MTPAVRAKDRLIVALDTSPEEARDLADSLAGRVGWVKVGMTLFYAAGPAMVGEMRAKGFEVFVDLKLHDIPHQVRGAAEVLARCGASMLTVHGFGGEAMIEAAVQGASRGACDIGLPVPTVLAVTVLTSHDQAGLSQVGVGGGVEAQVSRLARVAADAGASGVVCSPHEAAAMRDLLGADAAIVTPGVRPAGADRGDQSRTATPAEALAAGASHLVVGRPITQAADRARAAADILAEMEAVL